MKDMKPRERSNYRFLITNKISKILVCVIAIMMCISTFIACTKEPSEKVDETDNETKETVAETGEDEEYTYEVSGEYDEYTKKYDLQGKLVEEVYEKPERLSYTIEYKYNDKGEIVQRHEYGDNPIYYEEDIDTTYIYGYAYTDSGKIETITNGEKVNQIFYDKDGNKTKLVEYFEGKIVYFFQYDKCGNEIVGIPISRDEKYECDEKGNITKIYRLSSDGSYELNAQYEYNEDGYLIKGTNSYSTCIYEYNKDGFLTVINEKEINGEEIEEEYTVIYQYDENGHLIDMDTKDGLGCHVEIKYDGNGRKIFERFKESGFRSFKYYYCYDESGKLYLKIYYSSEGDFEYDDFECTYYSYDENGNLIKEERKECKAHTVTYEYDENGKVIKEIGVDKFNHNRQETERKYDEKGNLIEESVFDRFGCYWITKYDGNGNVVDEEYYYSGRTYDENGNLVEREEYDV